MSDENNNIQSYTPTEIIGIFSNILSRQNEFAQVTRVKGIYVKNPTNPKWAYCYDTLKDTNTNNELTVRITHAQQATLETGNLVTFYGILERKIDYKGNVQLALNVTQIEKIQEQVVSEADQMRVKIRREKSQVGFKNIDSLLEGMLMRCNMPHIALVFANTSITMADFEAGINAAKAFMQFDEMRVNFNNPTEVCTLLSVLDNREDIDVVALVRGGGLGIECLDNVQILTQVAKMEKPVMAAIGHQQERLAIKDIVDKECPTPNGLAQYFSDLCERVCTQKSKSEAVLMNEAKKMFQDQIEGLQNQLKQQSATLHESQTEVANLKYTIRSINDKADQKRKKLIKAIVYLSIALAASIVAIYFCCK